MAIFYAVAKGRTTGIFHTWDECEQSVKGFKGAKFKKFKYIGAAAKFILNSPEYENVPTSTKNNAVISKRRSKKNLSASFEKVQDTSQAHGLAARTVDENLVNISARTRSSRLKSATVKKEPLENILNIKQEPTETVHEVKQELQSFKNIFIKKEPKNEELDNEDFDMICAMANLIDYPDEPLALAEIKLPNEPVKQQPSVEKTNTTFVDVYTAGNHGNIGHWNSMAGYGVYFGENNKLNLANSVTGKLSHFSGDLEATMQAIIIAIKVGIPRLCIHTESQFLYNAVTKWIFGWKKRDWRNQNGKVISNRPMFQKLDKLLTENDIIVKWKLADKEVLEKNMLETRILAKIGIEKYLAEHPTKDGDSFSSDDF